MTVDGAPTNRSVRFSLVWTPNWSDVGSVENKSAAPLFEAILTPYRSISRRGVAVVFVLLAIAVLLLNIMMVHLGALPVIGFSGAGFILLATFYAMNLRAARAGETIVLTPERLTVTRTDSRGRRSETVLSPYWLSVTLEERPGSVPVLAIVGKRERCVVGSHLGEAERRDLAQALEAAFRRLRSPSFDNPQTRTL